MRVAYTQVDAFADAPFTGNPAGVLLLDEWLDDALMRRIAGETHLPATAFIGPAIDGDGDYGLRWFTPILELMMCGHATLAAGHVLLAADAGREDIRFATARAGMMTVTREAAGYTLDLPARDPVPASLPGILAALGPHREPLETLWHDEQYAVIVLEDEDAVRAIRPDFRLLAALGDHLTVVTARGDSTDIVIRAFAPAGGRDEDSVTGSAFAITAPYWCRQLGRAHFSAFQASRRSARVECRMDGARVLLTGGCVTMIEGTMLL